MTRIYAEPFLGAGAVLLALLDPDLEPGWGYMGGKRRIAYRILASIVQAQQLLHHTLAAGAMEG